MFTRVSEYVTQQLEKENIITSENRELYRYGIQNGLVIALNSLTSLLIGIIFGELVYSILLLAVYIPLRTYAGGYHASTQIRLLYRIQCDNGSMALCVEMGKNADKLLCNYFSSLLSNLFVPISS